MKKGYLEYFTNPYEEDGIWNVEVSEIIRTKKKYRFENISDAKKFIDSGLNAETSSITKYEFFAEEFKEIEEEIKLRLKQEELWEKLIEEKK